MRPAGPGVGLPKPTTTGDGKLHILDQKFSARELPHLNERLPFHSQLNYGDNNISKHIPVSSRRNKKLEAVAAEVAGVLLCSMKCYGLNRGGEGASYFSKIL